METSTILQIFPPVIAILIVLITKKPLLGLSLGVVSGTIILSDFNFKFFTLFGSNIFQIFSDTWNIKLLISLFLLGAFIGIVETSIYKKEVLSKFFNTKKKVLLMGWISGVLLFIDDYFNILLNGLFLKSFAKKHNISKEKIAFIIHSLGVSACVLIPFSTWTIFIVSIVNNLNISVTGFNIFVNSIPFNFYSISLILTTLAVIIFEIDLLHMKKAEQKTLEKEKQTLIKTKKISLKTLLLPAAILIFTSIVLILFSMNFEFSLTALENVAFIDILIISSLTGIVFGIFYYLKKKIIRPKKIVFSLFSGAKQMKAVVGILVLAWLLGITTEQLGTTNAILEIANPYLTPQLLTLVAFLITAGMAFMTSSWATFAITIPILIPLGISIGVNPSYVLAAIISGGVFGDHMSPISSTSILTKAVSKSEIHKHFRSQLPYSIIAFVMSSYLFFLIGTI